MRTKYTHEQPKIIYLRNSAAGCLWIKNNTLNRDDIHSICREYLSLRKKYEEPSGIKVGLVVSTTKPIDRFKSALNYKVYFNDR